MFGITKYRRAALLSGVLLGLIIAGPASARTVAQPPLATQQVDLVIALDVSGSMSGLIESAKQRLWDVVNELGRAQPQPELRVSIITFGNPSYGADSGYVRIDQPFTSDLDTVNQVLFSFGTNGGDEYVARAVTTSVQQLDWSTSPNAMKILFVAGNEGAAQDPQISVDMATAMATAKGIVVNTIYCGGENDGDAAGWRAVANLTNGMYASINQDAAAVANIATPMDDELLRLNQELNDTYVAFGADGDRFRANQREQDKNAGLMSAAAAASRTVAKAGKLYDASQWDLVDAVESGKRIEDIPAEELPVVMQEMEVEERAEFIEEKSTRRDELKARIGKLDQDRRDYIKKERAAMADSGEEGLDEAMQRGIRALAEQKGFTFEE